MSLTVADVREYVRDYLELDDQDLVDSVINQWIRDGFNRIVKQRSDWTGYATSGTVTTVASTADYTLPFTAGDVVQVYGTDSIIPRLERAEAEYRFNAGETDTNSQPEAYSVTGQTITFWPTPDTAYTYTIRGFRTPSTPLTGSGSAIPDLPNDEAHSLLLDFVVAQANVNQDDYEKATWFQKQFDEGLKQLAAADGTSSSYTPVVVNGRIPTGQYPAGPARWPGTNFPAW